MDSLQGRYQCTPYIGTASENGYHRVEIVSCENEDDNTNNKGKKKIKSYRWINDAGVSWLLTADNNTNSKEEFLTVGSTCPYYSQGYTKCQVKKSASGQIVALCGPGNEWYDKTKEVVCIPEWKQQAPSTTTTTGNSRNRGQLPNQGQNQNQNQKRTVLLLSLSETERHWEDLAYLAAIPASSYMNHGRPTVVVPSSKSKDAISDFCSRYQPTQVIILDSGRMNIEIPNSNNNKQLNIQRKGCKNLHSMTIQLANLAWPSTKNNKDNSQGVSTTTNIVIAVRNKYPAALLASSFAARLGIPLFYSDMNPQVIDTIQNMLHPKEVFCVGMNETEMNKLRVQIVQTTKSPNSNATTTKNNLARFTMIEGINNAIAWLTSHNIPVEYLAVANPQDRIMAANCTTPKLSLTAPLYTARRNGLVVPLVNISIEKNNNDNNQDNPKDRLQRALNQVRRAIQACQKSNSARTHPPPEHVALVGGFDVLPTCQTQNDCNNTKDWTVTDIPYGNIPCNKNKNKNKNNNNDKNDNNDCTVKTKTFRDIAIGRIYAESLNYGTLLAARTVNYDLLVDHKTWACRVVECGKWGFPELTNLFQLAKIDDAPQHLLKAPTNNNNNNTPNLDVAVILHKDHSCATGLGSFVENHTNTLFAPAVVLTRGCNAAGIDKGHPTLGTVAGRMLARGCVCYVGSPRIAITSSTLTEVAMFHELLFGSDDTMSVGKAMRGAFNKAIVHHLDGGHMNHYSIENELLLGDPALVPCFANAGAKIPCHDRAASSFDDKEGIVTVVGPREWKRATIHRNQLDEWKYQGDLFTYVAPGVEQETIWCHRKYDKQELYHVVTVHLKNSVKLRGVTALDATEKTSSGNNNKNNNNNLVHHPNSSSWTKRWWPSQRYFVQDHPWDGSQTVRWRIRLLDYDMETGNIHAELKSARFRLER